MLILRLWLGMVVLTMLTYATSATGYLISDKAVTIPFLCLAIIAVIWIVYAWHPKAIIGCTSLMTVGIFLRGVEVIIFAEQFTIQQRVVGTTLWWFIASTTLAVGILNLVAASRQRAERWVIQGGTPIEDDRTG
jgi:hypothetical protein